MTGAGLGRPQVIEPVKIKIHVNVERSNAGDADSPQRAQRKPTGWSGLKGLRTVRPHAFAKVVSAFALLHHRSG